MGGATVKLKFVPLYPGQLLHHGPGRRTVARAGDVVEVDAKAIERAVKRIPGKGREPCLVPFDKTSEEALYELFHGPAKHTSPATLTPPAPKVTAPTTEAAPSASGSLAEQLGALDDDTLKALDRILGGRHRSRETQLEHVLEQGEDAISTALAELESAA